MNQDLILYPGAHEEILVQAFLWHDVVIVPKKADCRLDEMRISTEKEGWWLQLMAAFRQAGLRFCLMHGAVWKEGLPQCDICRTRREERLSRCRDQMW